MPTLLLAAIYRLRNYHADYSLKSILVSIELLLYYIFPWLQQHQRARWGENRHLLLSYIAHLYYFYTNNLNLYLGRAFP